MIPASVLIPFALRALKFLIAIPKLRAKLAADVAVEGRDVSPQIVNALSGNAEAIKLLSDQIDEAIAFNKGAEERLEQRRRREGSGLGR